MKKIIKRWWYYFRIDTLYLVFRYAGLLPAVIWLFLVPLMSYLIEGQITIKDFAPSIFALGFALLILVSHTLAYIFHPEEYGG